MLPLVVLLPLLNQLAGVAALPSPAPAGSAPAVKLSVPKTSIVAGGFMQVSWIGAPGSTDDWITYTDGSAPSSSTYIADSWQYTYTGIDKKGIASTASGTVSIKAPSTPGKWTIFYCVSNGYTCTSGPTITTTTPQLLCRGPGKTASSISNVVVVIPENHSFDSYYGRYCQAPAGTVPSCNYGRQCCAQFTPIAGLQPVNLTDAENLSYDPNHTYDSELCEINGGKMDKFVTTGVSGTCTGANDRNFAIATGDVGSAAKYWEWASKWAMSDSFFQSSPGQSSENDMFFARGAFVFKDNDVTPPSEVCLLDAFKTKKTYSDPTIADLLIQCGVSFGFYAEDFGGSRSIFNCYPGHYDAGDCPFEYYPSITSSGKYLHDFTQFAKDVAGHTLPAVSYIKALGTRTEHPGVSDISSGEAFTQGVIDTILSSPSYNATTLIVIVPDESGGYRDSRAPPSGLNPVDNKPWGPRTPFIVVGNMVKKGGYISHVQIEAASLVRFIESNFLAGAPGQLETRDAIVNNIGDLLDQSITGFTFP